MVILEQSKEQVLAKGKKNQITPKTTTKTGKQAIEHAKPEEKTPPESLLNQLIGKSVVNVDDVDFKFAVL